MQTETTLKVWLRLVHNKGSCVHHAECNRLVGLPIKQNQLNANQQCLNLFHSAAYN